MKWSSFGGSSSLSRWALLLAVLLFWVPLTVQGQSSTPPSPATVKPNPQTTPTDSPTLQSLLPLAEVLVLSATDSEQKSTTFEANWLQERLQRRNDNDSKTKEIASWQATSEKLSSRVTLLSNWQSDYETLLGGFSGSEAENHAAAVKKLGNIQKAASSLETQVSVLRIGAWTFGITAGIGAGYFVGHVILKWW